MKNKQAQPNIPKVSIFDKRKQNNFSIGKSVVGHNQTKGNIPQFRLNQHKGA